VHAALLLGSLGGAAGEAVPELYGMLRDTESQVRVAAALALARIRRPGGSLPETTPTESIPGS
jgi:HEAT repeat protein